MKQKQLQSQKITCSKKVLKLKKMCGLGENWTCSWDGWPLFIYMVLTGMHNSCSLYSLYPTAFNGLQRSRYRFTVNIITDDVHLIFPKSHLKVRLDCQVTMISKLPKMCFKKYFRKKFIHQLGFEPPTSCLRVSCSTYWAKAFQCNTA